MIRFFDIVFSSFGLILGSPLFILLSIWIKVDSSGPVIFKQDRVGKNGSTFPLYKFRSMYHKSSSNLQITVGTRDSRITRSGYFLRKYKLDELPQLINVFLGDMSIVGPRPEVRKYVDYYSDDQKFVLSVKPGITDYASIKFVNENELLSRSPEPEQTYIKEIIPLKIELNKIFISSPTLKNYFAIILLTIKGLLK
jgi:lipopolysaccharide/colanic/teichoic acid biosynthesis glycosyltransferase